MKIYLIQKRRRFPKLLLVLLISLAFACNFPGVESMMPTAMPDNSAQAAYATDTPQPLGTPTPIDTPGVLLVPPFTDVRDKDLTKLNGNLGRSLIETLWFNESTTWSEQDTKIAQDILESGKNPGLGIRGLHAKGITGKGVNVAIIDQDMQLDHPEFKGKIV